MAEALFQLREHSLALTNGEAIELYQLWQSLDLADQQKSQYSARFSETIHTGFFKRTKSTVPGVDAMNR